MKSFQTKIFDFFQKHDVENFIGVPDSTLKEFISYGLKKKKLLLLPEKKKQLELLLECAYLEVIL